MLGEVRELIRETLKAHDAELAASAIQKSVRKAGGDAYTVVDTSGKMLNIFAKIVSGNPSIIEDAMITGADSAGWSLLSKKDRGKGMTWWFEPKPEVKGSVHSSKLPSVLYHTTIADNVNGILEKGLEPRTRKQAYAQTSRTYSPRIYLGTSEMGAKATVNRPGDWKMLKIDRSKLPKSTKFYVDQEFGHRKDGTPVAVYTIDPIPPSAIEAA